MCLQVFGMLATCANASQGVPLECDDYEELNNSTTTASISGKTILEAQATCCVVVSASVLDRGLVNQ